MCNAVMEAIETKRDKNDTVTKEGMCLRSKHVGEKVRNSNGVSIYFPWGEWENQAIFERYKDLKFLETSKWDKFLKEYRKLAADFENKEGIFTPVP